MRFASTELSSGTIDLKIDSSIDIHQKIIGAAGASNERRWLRIPDGADENHLVVLTAEDESKYIEEDEDAKLAAQWVAMRKERDSRLSACDWTQMPDSPLGVSPKAAWADYRQELRDLPAETEDPSAPTWPSQPA
jgi:hypothetical protein